MEIWDISPVVSSDLAVFPGDVSFQRKIAQTMQEGATYALSSFSTTCHIGAHADAPSHYDKEGASIDRVDLKRYLGKAQVVTASGADALRVRITDLSSSSILAPRVLIRTNSFPNPNQWSDAFWGVHPDLVYTLHKNGVELIGIDTPSVDPATDTELMAHAALKETGISNLEGLVLRDVSDGVYELAALPLRIKDADAAPVRAALFRRT